MMHDRLATVAIAHESPQFMQYAWRVAVTGTLLAGTPLAAQAAFIPPSGLNPGDHYRVVFLTSTATNATNTDISVYNSFVTTAAAPDLTFLATTWSAIASTAAINAVDNIACAVSCASLPIFRVDGTRVANSTADLFDGSILVPINRTASGAIVVGANTYAWTGSNQNGVNSGFPLGAIGPTIGDFTFSTSIWINFNLAGNTSLNPLYAISGDLVVPEPVPEPASLSLFMLGGLVLAAARRRWRGFRLTA